MRFRGDKTEKVTLKQRTFTYNDYNEEVEDWDSNDEPIYAEFRERHGKEGDSDGQIAVIQDVRCKVRYKQKLDPDIDGNTPEADFRIKRGTTTYDIVSITKGGRNEELMMMLTRKDNL